MVTYHYLDGHPPTLGWSPTRRKCTTDMEFGNYTLLTKLQVTTAMDGPLPFLWGSPADPRMVTHQPKDGYPIWPCLALFDTIWPGLPMFGPAWPRLAPHSGAARIVLNCVELNIFMIWDGYMLYATCYILLYATCYTLYATCYKINATCYILHASFYMILATWTTWDYLRQLETTWDYMRLLETTWDYLRLLETTRDFSRLFKTIQVM